VHYDICTAIRFAKENSLWPYELSSPPQTLGSWVGRATAKAVSRWLPTAAARVRARVCHVEFVVDKVVLRKAFSEYFVSTENLHSTNCSTVTIIYHLGLVQQASSGRSTKWTQSHHTKNN
jgi:hypothetical protein